MSDRQENFDNDLNIVRLWLEEDLKEIELPPSLKSENLMHLLADISPDKAEQSNETPKAKIIPFKLTPVRIAGYAACLALAMFGIFRITDSEIGKHIGDVSDDATQFGVQSAAPAAPQGAPQAEAWVISEETEEDAKNEVGYDFDDDDDEDMPAEGAEPENAEVAPAAIAQDEELDKGIDGGYGAIFSNISTNASAREEITKKLPDILLLQAGDAQRFNPATASDYLLNQKPYDTSISDEQYTYAYTIDEDVGSKITITSNSDQKQVSEIFIDGYSNAQLHISESNLVIVNQMPANVAEEITADLGDITLNDIGVDISVVDSVETIAFNPLLSEISIYDVSDKGNPRETFNAAQSGKLVASTLYEDTIYTISRKRIGFDTPSGFYPAASAIPYIYSGGTTELLKAENIIIPALYEDDVIGLDKSGYAVVTEVLLTGDPTLKSTAMLASFDGVLLDENHIYLSASIYHDAELKLGVSKHAIEIPSIIHKNSVILDVVADRDFSMVQTDGKITLVASLLDEENKLSKTEVRLDRDLNILP